MSQRWLLPEVRGPSVTELWRRLEAHFAAHAPEVLEFLNPPASEDALLQAAKALDGNLPSDLAESLRVHDGQPCPDGVIGLVPALFDPLRNDSIATWGELAPIDHIVNSSLSRGQWAGEVLPLESLRGDEFDGPAPRNNCASWIVFVDPGSGDVLALDLAPGPCGQRGQVVAIDHGPARLTVLAPSYRAWFEELVTRYESGRYIIAQSASGSRYAKDRENPGRG
jgi:cell wall assembly regulator SMI1